MATLKQIDAAHANGAKSTGPKTPETKSISSRNSLKHGFTSKTVVLQNENPTLFEELLRSYIEEFRPESQPELDLIGEMATARWRLRRLWRIETATLDLAMDRQAPQLEKEFDSFDEGTRLACAFTKLADESRSLALLSRYETRLRKSYDQALHNLLTLQDRRKPPAPEPTPKSASPDSVRNEPSTSRKPAENALAPATAARNEPRNEPVA